MRTKLPHAVLAATLIVAAPALAQAPSAVSPAPGVQPATPPTAAQSAPSASIGSSADTAANASAGASLMTGMSVKDNTGAIIGEVKGIKSGVATIQMDSDTFTVDTDKLGVSNGAANINASKADLKKMLPPKK
jgi:hypothetical protein